MKKIVALSTVILSLSTNSAYAGGFHLNFFAPAPVYVAPAPIYVAPPRPVYVVEQYPAYNYYYSTNNYDYEHGYWYSDDWKHRHHKRKHHNRKHREHHDD